MAQTLTTTASALSSKDNIQQQVILEIDGLPVIFGAVQVTRYAKIGDFGLKIGDFKIGDVYPDPDGRDWISLKKSTNNITTSIEPDKSGASSIQKYIVQLVDVKTQVTDMFQPSKYIPDVLGRPATVYLGFVGGSHPEDSIVILNGVVENVDSGSGFVNVAVTHPDNLKKSNLFQEFTSQLVGAIDDSTDTINLDRSTDTLISPQDAVGTYIRIDDEIMRVDTIAPTSLTVTRAQLNTVANAHDDEAEVVSFYTLTGNAVDIALKIMMSGASELTSSAKSIGNISPIEIVPNSIFFLEYDVQKIYGLVIGDFVTLTGSIHIGNNNTFTIQSFETTDTGSYIVVEETNVNEIDADISVSFKSKYDVLDTGCKMNGKQVDVSTHENFLSTYGSSFESMTIYIKESVVAKDLLEQEIYFPAGLYPIPRAGKASCNMTLPPLASVDTKSLTALNIRDPKDITMKRSINKNFYNSIVYKYEIDSLEDDFLESTIYVSGSSFERIAVENKPLIIESKGLRRGSETFISRQSRRFADRYQFAAEETNVKVLYKAGFNVDVGDIVILDPENLQVADINTGSRDFKPRLMEVKQKAFSILKGDISLDLIDTAFNIDARYGVISPSSLVKAGSTSSKISLKPSFGSAVDEYVKWETFIGYKALIHNDDWTIQEEFTIVGIDTVLPDTILTESPLSFTPTADMIIDPVYYPDNEDSDDQILWKRLHVFLQPQIAVTSGASNTVFDVAAVDKLRVGQLVRVHNEDFSTDSGADLSATDAEITDITGLTITVSRDLGFTPDNTMSVDLIGFKDGELPYRYI